MFVGNSLAYSNTEFSTYDRDNDKSGINCAVKFYGAGWYRNCYLSNLNGRYRIFGPGDASGLVWYRWKKNYSLKETVMKIRPK